MCNKTFQRVSELFAVSKNVKAALMAARSKGAKMGAISGGVAGFIPPVAFVPGSAVATAAIGAKIGSKAYPRYIAPNLLNRPRNYGTVFKDIGKLSGLSYAKRFITDPSVRRRDWQKTLSDVGSGYGKVSNLLGAST